MDTLRVGTALPDPPFAAAGGGLAADLGTAIGAILGLRVEVVACTGPGVAGLFDALADGSCDCVISSVPVTAEVERVATFAPPYLIAGQSLAVDAGRFPTVHSIDDLAGLTVGVQRGTAGEAIAERLLTAGQAGAVRTFDRDELLSPALDLAAIGCDAIIALGPVLTELVKPLVDAEVVQHGLSREDLAVAVARGNEALLAQIATAQDRLDADGALQEMRRRWLGNPYRDQSLAAR